MVESPAVLDRHAAVADALALLPKRSHRAAVVVADGRPVGIVAEDDCTGVDRFTQVSAVMTPDPVTISADLDPRAAFDALHEARRRLAPAVDADGRIVGVVTRTDALRSTIYRPALDGSGRLRSAAAVGVSGEGGGKAAAWAAMGVDALVGDTAHGHQDRMIQALKLVREAAPDAVVAAGNVVSADGARALVEAGASSQQAGVGPCAARTTRQMTGLGRPHVSAVREW